MIFMKDKMSSDGIMDELPELEEPLEIRNFSKLKECLAIAISAKSPKINLIKNCEKSNSRYYDLGNENGYCDKEGDVEFYVYSRHLGLTAPMLKKYENEIISVVFANIIGELLVRENMSSFVDIITSLNPHEYVCKVNNCIHENFGIIIDGRRLIFKFHSSLIQKIVTENFKGIINEKTG